MTDRVDPSGDDQALIFHRTERFAHGIYGLIIITAVLVAEAEHTVDPIDALVIVVGTGLVLLLAHTYVAVVAERTLLRHRLDNDERVEVLIDNLPVLLAVLGPSLLFIAAETGAIEIETAFRWAIGSTVAALYAIGVFESRRVGYTWARSLIMGLGGALIGAVIIAVESLI